MELYFHDLDRDVLILAADGGLNADTADQFVKDIEGVAKAGIQKLIVDCSGLSYISSRGLRSLLMINARMKSRGCDVRIAGAKSFVLDAFRMTRLDTLFRLYPDVNAARLALRPRDKVAKRDLRDRSRESLSAVSPAQRDEWSARIRERLLDSVNGLLPPGACVMLFAPKPSAPEVDLAPLARDLLARDDGTRIAVPRIDWNAKAMAPALVRDFDADIVLDDARPELALPVARPEAPALDPAVIDVVILPGLAFDYSGNRLGRGGGFYDRFLAALPEHRPLRIGVAFDLQLADSVPTDEHDQRLHALVTPTLVLRFT